MKSVMFHAIWIKYHVEKYATNCCHVESITVQEYVMMDHAHLMESVITNVESKRHVVNTYVQQNVTEIHHAQIHHVRS